MSLAVRIAASAPCLCLLQSIGYLTRRFLQMKLFLTYHVRFNRMAG